MGICERLASKLGSLLDGELGPRDERRVREHLKTCARCRSDLEAMQALEREAVAALQPPAPTEGDWRRVGTAIQGAIESGPVPAPRSRPARPRAREWWVPALALAATILILALIGIYSRPAPEATRPTDAYSSKGYEIREEPLAPEEEDGATWIWVREI